MKDINKQSSEQVTVCIYLATKNIMIINKINILRWLFIKWTKVYYIIFYQMKTVLLLLHFLHNE